MITTWFNQSYDSRKVPAIDLSFWVIKLLTTAMGEATSDFLVHRVSPVLAVLGTAVVFGASLWWQFTRSHYETVPYWGAVIMVSVFGTMCADVAHVGLHIAYVVSMLTFGVVLAGVFFTWRRVEGTLAIHSVVTRRRELFYWITVTVTFALGTATGDFTATSAHWGFLASGLVFTCAFALPGLVFWWSSRGAVGAFWISYILTRPLGASDADWLGVSHARGGLNWGPGNVALIFSGALLLTISWRYIADQSALTVTPTEQGER